jgi:hypothetical protein
MSYPRSIGMAELYNRFMQEGIQTNYTPSELESVADVRHQGHESGSLYSLAHGVLAGCGATRFTSRNNSAVSINKLGQQFDVLVINVHWTWAFAIDQKGILLLNPNFHSGPFARNSLSIWRPPTEGSLEI